MKKLFFAALLIICSQFSFAQKDNTGDNELKFNIPLAIYGLPEVSYERIIEDNMALGLSVSIGADKPYNYLTDKGIPERSIFCSYYRLYFGKKKAAGFYLEGNMAVASQKEINVPDYIGGPLPSQSSTGFGFGAAVGVKLLTKNGFTGDFYGGWGRLFGDNVYNSYPRVGICIGKRF